MFITIFARKVSVSSSLTKFPLLTSEKEGQRSKFRAAASKGNHTSCMLTEKQDQKVHSKEWHYLASRSLFSIAGLESHCSFFFLWTSEFLVSCCQIFTERLFWDRSLKNADGQVGIKKGNSLWAGSSASCNVFVWPAVDSIASYEIQCSEYFPSSKGSEVWSTVSSIILNPAWAQGERTSIRKCASGYLKILPSPYATNLLTIVSSVVFLLPY